MSNAINNFFRSYTFKFIVIGTLSLLLLIPSMMIRKIINEREFRNSQVTDEISKKWSNTQTLTGPFISIPIEETLTEDEKLITYRSTFHLLPEELFIDGSVHPLEKKRGSIRAVVYDSEIILKGLFTFSDPELLSIVDEKLHTGNLHLSLGISDLRGVGNGSEIDINGKAAEIRPGLYNHQVATKGFHTTIPVDKMIEGKKLEFEIRLDLKGSSSLFLTPTGKVTEVNLQSQWPDPSFDGSFLPSSSEISDTGFSAVWQVNYLNRNYPQQWYEMKHTVSESSFGINFLIPVDHYQKSERSVKYAFMFIALTFLVFFLAEVISKRKIHPIQYLLVGLALVIFYTLLVSLAEHIGFNTAYLISTIAITLLTGTYIKSATASNGIGLLSVLFLTGLYGYLFTVLQLQEYSLLMGSIGLFLVLGIVMFVTRKINWYREESPEE